MTVEFWITTLAIVVGPLSAVMIAHWLQIQAGKRQSKLHVFRTLMTTRRTPLSPERGQALNLVEVEFYRRRDVQDRFKDLLTTYNDQVRWKAEDENIRKLILQEVDDKSVQLLRAIGASLGYRLESLELLRGSYYPEAFSALENQQMEIRQFLASLNRGRPINVAVLDVRHPEKILDQARVTQKVIDVAVQKEP